MSSHTATMRETAAAKWAAAKPIAFGLAIGLAAGPVISGLAGFQVRTSTAQAAARAGAVEQQAAFCAERARAASTGTALLDWQGRTISPASGPPCRARPSSTLRSSTPAPGSFRPERLAVAFRNPPRSVRPLAPWSRRGLQSRDADPR